MTELLKSSGPGSVIELFKKPRLSRLSLSFFKKSSKKLKKP